MSAANKNITVEIGVTFSARFIWKNKANGSAFNLTGYTGSAQIRSALGSTATLICTMTVTVNSAVGGDFTISIPAATTATLTSGSYFWDCKFTAGSTILRPMKGLAQIVKTE